MNGQQRSDEFLENLLVAASLYGVTDNFDLMNSDGDEWLRQYNEYERAIAAMREADASGLNAFLTFMNSAGTDKEGLIGWLFSQGYGSDYLAQITGDSIENADAGVPPGNAPNTPYQINISMTLDGKTVADSVSVYLADGVEQ